MHVRLLSGLVALLAVAPAMPQDVAHDGARPPNIVLVLADDLGVGEVGCYGQERIRTPHVDALAAAGMRLDRAWAGSPVCAPSRCVLLTGVHAGRAQIRNNSPWARRDNPHGEGQEPLAAGTVTLATRLRDRGYATGAVGKWGLGGPGTVGAPEKQGFDTFLGYLCQAHAHDHYPAHLWRDGEEIALDNPDLPAHEKLTTPPADWSRYGGEDYAPDRFLAHALEFVEAHRDRPFFLYYATTIPHAALQVPDAELAAYPEDWDAEPYLGQQGYLPHPRPRAAYAAMVTRMDRDVGTLLARIDELGLAGDTVVVFTSDNGPTYNGGTDSDFFASSGGLRGRKGSVYEGGLRTPLVVRWPGVVAAGSSTTEPVAFDDLAVTLLDLAGAGPLPDATGRSVAPTLAGGTWRGAAQASREAWYWELGGSQAVCAGDLKLVRRVPRRGGEPVVQLFDLAADPVEAHDLAADRPVDVGRLLALLGGMRTPSARFPSPFDR